MLISVCASIKAGDNLKDLAEAAFCTQATARLILQDLKVRMIITGSGTMYQKDNKHLDRIQRALPLYLQEKPYSLSGLMGLMDNKEIKVRSKKKLNNRAGTNKKKSNSSNNKRRAHKLRESGLSYQKIADKMGMSKRQVMRYFE